MSAPKLIALRESMTLTIFNHLVYRGTGLTIHREVQQKKQSQTPAVDIWSLGIVTLMLLTPSLSDYLGDLNRMDEESLEAYIKEAVINAAGAPSLNGCKFILSCLQISPKKRMSAIEAECHDWLCSPDSHLEFFQKLDRKIMSNWRKKNQVTPMPLDLPDLLGCMSKAPKSNKLPLDGGTEQSSQKSQSPYQDEDSEYFPALSNINSNDDGSFKKPDLPKHKNIASKPKTDNHKLKLIDESATKNAKNSRMPWEQFHGHKVSRSSQSTSKHKKKTLARVHDLTFHPLTGLDRHLRQNPPGSRREQVLAELKRTNSKFLVEAVPIFTNSAPILEQ